MPPGGAVWLSLVGVQFETVDPANQTIIDTFVDAHFFSNRKA